MPEAVIVAAARSPIGRARKGRLAGIRPDDLASQMITAALDQVPELDRADVQDLALGVGMQEGVQGGNLARPVALLAGLDATPAATVNRFCASSIQTTRMALHAIRAGEAHTVISAGVESISSLGAKITDDDARNPRFKTAWERSDARARREIPAPWTDPTVGGTRTPSGALDEDHLPDPYIAMGQTAENVAELRGITRRDQDEYAVRSQQRAEAAIASGFFATDITPVTLPDGTVVDTDDSPRPGVTLEAVSQLDPVFRENGTVTAGNACPLNDGAAALVIMSIERARDLGITPLARIVATGVSGLNPEIMGLGPVDATRQALAHAGMTIDDIDLVELNEAFAAMVLPSADDLGIDHDRLNVHGGAIALGHPWGQTGARMTTTLINGLRARDGQLGLATLCVGGGQGMALILERMS